MIATLQPAEASARGTSRDNRRVFLASANGVDDTRVADRTAPTVQRTVRSDGICVLTFDRPGSAANIFDLRTLRELSAQLAAIDRTPEYKGLVLTSAKPAVFIAGADLKSMAEASSEKEITELINLGQTVMNQLAALKIPTAAAMHGAAVGGGYEVCLACDYRVASNEKATKIGLPEIQLGLLPAWGGSTRLPRLIGLPKALGIILAGKTVAPKQALKCGMVDEIAPAEYLMTRAARLIKQGKPKRVGHPLVNNQVTSAVLAARLRSQLRKKTRGNYPAVMKALEVITRGIGKSVAESLALEREGILDLIQTDACRNLVRVFFLQERAKKRTSPVGTPESELKPIERAAVIGAGVMGAGIAQWLSARQVRVMLRDINADQVAKGMGTIAKIYQDAVKHRVFSPVEARAGMDRISPAAFEASLKRAEIVIEAAAEKMEIKRKIFARLDELASEETILATNTSALPVSELAAATRQPERVLGLHFFNPVHRMQLVEIVAGRQTSPKVLQRAMRFVQQLGKLPVIVKDSPGFLVNRILMGYLVEAGNLFEAGAEIEHLDKAMLDFGMPMGPMRLLDEVGIDVALHVAGTMAGHYCKRMRVPETLSQLVHAGMLGRKSGSGFYLHQKGASRVNQKASVFVRHSKASGMSLEELQRRMVLMMVNESARCLEEAIVSEPADVDFAMIMGTGFAPFRGGPLRYADSLGSATVVEAMDGLAQAGAAHFQPCELLRSMAAHGKKFYLKK